MALVRGGQAVYGAALGGLMLEARFARVPGDMGNAAKGPFPVHDRVVRGASPERVTLGPPAARRGAATRMGVTRPPRAKL